LVSKAMSMGYPCFALFKSFSALIQMLLNGIEWLYAVAKLDIVVSL